MKLLLGHPRHRLNLGAKDEETVPKNDQTDRNKEHIDKEDGRDATRE
jgi:hypothetical protein